MLLECLSDGWEDAHEYVRNKQSVEDDDKKTEKGKVSPKHGGKDKLKGKNDYSLQKDYDVDIIYQGPTETNAKNDASTEEHEKKAKWEDTLKKKDGAH